VIGSHSSLETLEQMANPGSASSARKQHRH
jgi:hypothetical protein